MATYYVSSQQGNNANDGSQQFPFQTMQRGVDALRQPGDKLIVRSGVYTESVSVRGKHGTADAPIRIEGELDSSGKPVSILQASITGKVFAQETGSENSIFHLVPSGGNNQWQRPTDPQAHPDEYVSKRVFPPPTDTPKWRVSYGAFIDPVKGRYCRLISYGRLENLRSETEWNPRDGSSYIPAYLGPGAYFNRDTRKIHLRLSPTTINAQITGLHDYEGQRNPNRVALSLCTSIHDRSFYFFALRVNDCSFLECSNLSLRFGATTIALNHATDIHFTNAEIWAGHIGVSTEKTVTSLSFKQTIFDGGLPDWLFRSDLKDEPPPEFGNNAPASHTHETLVNLSSATQGVEFSHCEFVNAHDLNLEGNQVEFHHNYISNLNDEALIMGGLTNAKVHHNVIRKSLSALSLVGTPTASLYIYRNLIDLQDPTAGYRPGKNNPRVWRFGRPFKNNDPTHGSCEMFQNTFVVPPNESGDIRVIDFLRGFRGETEHRSLLNNLFAVLNHPSQESIIAYLPPAHLSGSQVHINGNLYFKAGGGQALFYVPRNDDPGSFDTFSIPRDSWLTHPFFAATRMNRPPGDEATQLFLVNPQFVRLNHRLENISPRHGDNFHLQASSPARRAGIVLPEHLRQLDLESTGIETPDVGCYQSRADGSMPILVVGVQGRRKFPLPPPVLQPK